MEENKPAIVEGEITALSVEEQAIYDAAAEKVLGKAPGSIKLLVDPASYASGAIACIEDQLLGVKSPKRKTKLEARLSQWKKTLDILLKED